ncbi:MAG TPA: hypothetical protein RMH99_20635 [Sandaracinaceae bacterium LLY-WYZ-13_1]|nr:hypothetical protein [Sandaracinaceae bacterium LLY-WYZ-13_1]
MSPTTAIVTALAALTTGLWALCAWRARATEHVQRAVAGWALGVTGLTAAGLVVPSAWSVTHGVALTAVTSWGLLGLCARVFRGRPGWPAWVVAAAFLALAHPALSDAIREALVLGLGAAGVAGAWLCVGVALWRGDAPGLAQLTVLGLAAAMAIRLVADPASAAVPLWVAATMAVGAHAWRRRAADRPADRTELGELEEAERDALSHDGPVDLRADGRVGDVVDVAEALRRRAARRGGRQGGVGEG